MAEIILVSLLFFDDRIERSFDHLTPIRVINRLFLSHLLWFSVCCIVKIFIVHIHILCGYHRHIIFLILSIILCLCLRRTPLLPFRPRRITVHLLHFIVRSCNILILKLIAFGIPSSVLHRTVLTQIFNSDVSTVFSLFDCIGFVALKRKRNRFV